MPAVFDERVGHASRFGCCRRVALTAGVLSADGSLLLFGVTPLARRAFRLTSLADGACAALILDEFALG